MAMPHLVAAEEADVVAAASSAGEGAKGEGQGLQLIEQELVPVSEPKRNEKAVEGGQKEKTPEDQFASLYKGSETIGKFARTVADRKHSF